MSILDEIIIKGLDPIDKNSVNMEREEIDNIIDSLIEQAVKHKSIKWEKFLESEKAYYKNDMEASYELNLLAYHFDLEECKNTGEKQNYYIVNSLAVCFYAKGDLVEAYKYFSESIELKKDNYQSYLDRATVARKMGNRKQAFLDCETVLKKIDETDELYFHAIETKARACLAFGDIKKANELLLSIFDSVKDDAEYLEALAQSFWDIGDYSKASEYYAIAKEKCKDSLLKKYIEIKQKSLEEDKKNDNYENTIKNLSRDHMELLEIISNNNSNNENIRNQYCKKYFQRVNGEYTDVIVSLQGWNSSSNNNFFELLEQKCECGGGYYVNFDGVGIAIDPGIDFVTNFHRQNLYIQDMDIIIVTHNHADSNNDLVKIAEAAHQIGHRIKYYIDKETYSKYDANLKNDDVSVINVGSDDNVELTKKKHKIIMKICGTKHNTEGSYGIKIYFKNKVIGYTSDTAYSDYIGSFFEDVDVLIAHIGNTDQEDIKLSRNISEHLGVKGIYEILNKIKKDNVVCLLTKFGGELGDIRLEIIKILNSYLGKGKIDIIPTDIPTKLFLNNYELVCNSCGERIARNRAKFVKMGKIKRIMCVCDKCSF